MSANAVVNHGFHALTEQPIVVARLGQVADAVFASAVPLSPCRGRAPPDLEAGRDARRHLLSLTYRRRIR
jgi:hypothetical protein